MILHHGFDFHFAGDWWYWAHFHVLVSHPCIFGEMSVHIVYSLLMKFFFTIGFQIPCALC